ncbi:HlyC/CorC family transporter [bacterium]|nr:HlyC/CorC family transporter [bacterium]
MGLYFILFVVLILLSAFFSGSEAAYFSISKLDKNHLQEQDNKSGSAIRVLKLLDKPKRLLMSILIGNTIVNVAAATIAALFTHRYLNVGMMGTGSGIIIEIGVVTMVILIFSEVSPKVFAVRQSIRFAQLVALPLMGVVKIFSPFSKLFEKLADRLSSLFRVHGEAPFVDHDDLITLFKLGEEKGALDQDEREMIHSIFEFRDTAVKEIMVPRMDMVCADKTASIEEILTLVKEKGHSRIPIYNETVDDIVGILFVKDLLPYKKDEKEIPGLASLVRKAYFVPESKMIDELLKEFQRERIHMAIVVDEYGGTAGLITLEDVIEEIVGEIRDEYDSEKPLIQKINDTNWIVDGKINIEELNDTLNLEIPSEEDYESLGGFIFSLMGRIPNEKEEIKYQKLKLVIEKVLRQRIKKVRIVLEDQKDV